MCKALHVNLYMHRAASLQAATLQMLALIQQHDEEGGYASMRCNRVVRTVRISQSCCRRRLRCLFRTSSEPYEKAAQVLRTCIVFNLVNANQRGSETF